MKTIHAIPRCRLAFPSARAFVLLVLVTGATVVMLASGAAWSASKQADEAKSRPSRTQNAAEGPRTERDAEDLLTGVVRVRVKSLPDARSNATLGSSREGSGVIIDKQGTILTIGYIVIEADSIEVTTSNNKTVSATLVGYDHASGFGLLRAQTPLDAKPLPMGQSADLAVREPVMILPFGGRESASLAYVVARRQFTGSWEYMLESAIFTSPPTFTWAGAALVSREGKLLGIGSLLVRDSAETGTPLPGNMFVPIDLLKPILADLMEKGRAAGAPRPWLGLGTEEVQGHLFVTRVSPEGPAARAGIKPGDIVIGVGAESVKTHEELYRKVWGLGVAGTDIPLKILQGSDMREVKVRSIDRFEYFRAKPTY
jgi:serine protease Do